MNRRSFLKKLGTGIAVAAIAPVALESLMVAPVTPVAATIGEYYDYYDYANFSDFAITESMDEMVMKTAVELGHRAGLSISALYTEAYS